MSAIAAVLSSRAVLILCLASQVHAARGEGVAISEIHYHPPKAQGKAEFIEIAICDDWYDDNPPEGPPGSIQAGAVPALNNMDRLRDGRFKDRNEPAIFEAALAADPKKVLVALILKPGNGQYQKGSQAYFNLFAITCIRLDFN